MKAHRYKTINIDPNHPVAKINGKRPPTTVTVYEHKYVLYEKVGPGPHPCHWCGTELNWLPGNRAGVILADHLDNDQRNNAPENLVVACNGCNTIRSRTGFRSAIGDDELVVTKKTGGRTRAVQLICQECGVLFLVEVRRANTAKVCSMRCAGAIGRRSRKHPRTRAADGTFLKD